MTVIVQWIGLTGVAAIRFHPALTGDRDAERAATEAWARDLTKSS